MSVNEGQQHPLSMYLKVWILLFVLSSFSYLVDFFQFQGFLRWSLILVFMFLKAGLILSIFMHIAWERSTLVMALGLPTIALMFLITLMMIEGDTTNISRGVFFSG